jgi:hypothetical protein
VQRNLLAVTAALEGITGFTLLVYPTIVIWLLFGTGIAGAGTLASRFAGLTLIALAVACWPGRDGDGSAIHALSGMLTYSVVATIYLGSVAIVGEFVGLLLWPAVAAHALLSILLARSVKRAHTASA